jgi:hypothetical protein
MRGFYDRWMDYRLARYHMRAVFLGPLVCGAAVMFLFAAVPQSREVYLGIIEDVQIFHGVLGLALVVLLSALLHYWQHMLATAAIDRTYPEHGDIEIDERLLALRDWLCRLSAALPLVGLALGLLKLVYDARDARTRLVGSLRHFGGDEWRSMFAGYETTTQLLPSLPFYVVVTALLAALILAAGFAYGRSGRARDRFGGDLAPRLVVGAGAGIAVASIVVPLAWPDHIIYITRLIGPLAGATLTVIAVVAVLFLLSYASNRLRLPIAGAVVLLLLGWMLFQTYRALTPVEEPGAARSRERDERDPGQLYSAFDAWLAARSDADAAEYARRGLRYPVFIVAAQGGGVYAASAAVDFLASMQDRCPAFAQHVFAISGVSGGAIGAALFAALQAERTLVPAAGCLSGSAAKTQPLTDAASDIVRQDHLSPALALLWPDVVRKLAPNPDFDRSSVLERSFACAFESKAAVRHCPAASASDGRGLRMPFAKHWDPSRPVPALIVTATWVETGFRAALAPFPLHAISDGTLFSLPIGANAGDFLARGARIEAPRSLIEAAFVSARYPGIVPAWQVSALIGQGGTEHVRLWNFVDGGYVDNSGASTALELYLALKAHVGDRPVDLYLILLTDADADPSLAEVSDGTRFSDTVAPITALLSVRAQLAQRAVRRAIDSIEPQARRDDLVGRLRPDRPGSKVLVVNLRQRTFELPLGWIISRTTADIVRLMMGRPELCDLRPGETGTPDIADAIRVINDNSCVRKRLIELLSPASG